MICHMVASVDGRTLTRRWRPQEAPERVVQPLTRTTRWRRLARGSRYRSGICQARRLFRSHGPELSEGGGNANGSFLRAGLIDEISLAIFPAVDGTKGGPCVFDSSDEEARQPRSAR